MNKWLLLLAILGAMPLSMMAQDDDMYFVPTKESIAKEKARKGLPASTYYSGSNRSVDEYNRRGGSYYEPIQTDSVELSDIIDFTAVEGVYPDSVEDFQLTRQMARFDDYEPQNDDYWQGYRNGLNDSWGWPSWHSPWFYNSYYPWYTGWYDPWFYDWAPYWGWGGYYGWYGSYRPWYYSYWGWGGWGYPYYWGGGRHYARHYDGPAGTERHGRMSYNGPRGISSGNGRTTTHSAGTFGGARSGSFGNRNTATRSTTARSNSTYSNQNGNFGGSRSSSSSSSSTRSYTPTNSGSNSGSFGGSRSSGGSFGGGGGGRSSGGGGGSFGGRR